jgi:hypothetical protein
MRWSPSRFLSPLGILNLRLATIAERSLLRPAVRPGAAG